MFNRSKSARKFLATLIAAVLLLGAVPYAAAAAQGEEGAEAPDVTIVLNGERLKLSEPARMKDGRLFLPAARIARAFDAGIDWDQDTATATIHSALGDEIELSDGVPVVYFNGARYVLDAAPLLFEGRMYVPLRDMAEMLHARLQWNPEERRAELTTVRPVAVTADADLTDIARENEVQSAALLKRNGLKSASAAKEGSELKVVVPSLFEREAEPFTEKDLMLLAKLTQVEAGYQSYEGQLAVANVVLNRVKDPRFPKTIRDVIYSGKQFPVAHNGLLDKSVPNASVLRAAKDALNGKCNVEGAVYFFNPRVTKGPFWSGLEIVADIGNHRFAK